MRTILILLCSIIFFPLASANASERSVTLQLPWYHQFQFAGYYAAIEQGYYKDAGLHVILKEGKPDLTSNDAVIDGSAEYGVGRSDVIIEWMQGEPVVLLASIFQHSASILLNLKESGIDTIKDIAGRRVMLKSGVSSAEYQVVLQREGVFEEDYTRQLSSHNLDDLIDGKTDVFNAYSTNEPFYLKERNIPYTAISPHEYGIYFYGDVLFTTEQEIKNHPQQVEAFRDASIRGWQYALDHPEEITDLLLTQYGVKKSREHLQFEAEEVRKLIMPDILEIGYSNPGRWQTIVDVFIELGLAPDSGKDLLDGFLYRSPDTPLENNVQPAFLTKEEEAYLKEKKVVKMCNNPKWEPIEFAKDGDMNSMQGISIDTLRLLEQKLNITFKNVPTSSWTESQQFLRDKKCDILPSAIRTAPREEYANFTEPYLHLPLAIFTRTDKPVVSGLNEIMTNPWTRHEGSGLITKLQDEYPDMDLIVTQSVKESFQQVSDGNAYFTIATLPIASHVLSKFVINNVHVAGYAGDSYDLSIAVRDDEPVLLSVLNKALENLTKEQSREIYLRWVNSLVREPVPDYLLLVQIIAAAALIVMFFIYRQYVLNKTIRKLEQAENQATMEKERLVVTLRSIGDGVITTDLDGNVILINKISEELTGVTQQEAVGKPIYEIFHIVNEHTGETCENPVKEVLERGCTVDLPQESTLISKNGTHYIIEDSAAPIFDKKSEVIGAVLVYRDVTEERKTKNELLKIEKLESVGVLAGGIAHDFNNILAAILGNIQMAAVYVGPESEALPLLQDAKKASIRAKDLTQQLLTFAKGGEPVKRTASIKEMITESAGFVLHGSSVLCNYDIPDDLWTVTVDTGQISQVIQNIIINANQAMPDGGNINVRCENISITEKEMIQLPVGKYIKVRIADSGSGIPNEIIEKIFDPYYSTKQKGSGLGLAISHSIIAKHGGHISVESNPNTGTVFTFYLPAAIDIEKEYDVALQGSVSIERSATILVMDDDEMVQTTIKYLLEQFGHKVLLAANGRDAIELYGEYYNSNRIIDLVIMDLTIPGGMGGKEAVQEVLTIDPTAKVVVASGYSTDPVLADCQKYGFKEAIAKPFQLEDLNALISRVLG